MADDERLLYSETEMSAKSEKRKYAVALTTAEGIIDIDMG